MPTKATSSISERVLLLLEIIAKAESAPTLNELMAATGLPKATTHRFASLLEQLGFARRSMDGRHYEVGHRLTALAIQTMQHSLQHATRRAILESLVSEIRETCNITMLDGTKLIYVDRVESDWPLQIRLQIGSHVPMHCTASGKLFLSLMPAPLRRRFLETRSLERHTPRTITDPARLEAELDKIARTEIGTDDEEFIQGMAAAAVPIRDEKGRICATVAVHGPTNRLPLKRAVEFAPAMKKAARAIEQSLSR